VIRCTRRALHRAPEAAVLTPLDDYLAHQIPETFDRVGTSDRNFFDRYYFNCHNLDGEVLLVLGMGLYPNLGVIDAFTSVVVDGTQHVIRSSRALGGDRRDPTVGPHSVEVLEGLRRLRIRCAPNEWAVSYDLTFEGVTFPYEEPRFYRRLGPRVVQDYLRITQNGRWSGTIAVAGRTFAVTPERWWGARDHSWGIRPVGDPEPRSGLHVDAPRSFYWNWSPQQYPDFCLMYTVSENGDGSRWHEAGGVLYPFDAGTPQVALTEVRHRLSLLPGTRTFAGGELFLKTEDGRELHVTGRPLATLYMSGVGYGGDWRHGMYRGPLAVEGDRWDLRDPETVRRISGLHEVLCEWTVDRGPTGYGVFEFLCIGPYVPYGFSSSTDVAP
jgi:hypothetical protein